LVLFFPFTVFPQETELKHRDEREQIEAKIKQLQEEISNKCDLERSLRDDIHRMSQTECNLQYLIFQSKCTKREISKRFQDESLKDRKCSQKISNVFLMLHSTDVAGEWFSPITRVSSTSKSDRHDLTEILHAIICLNVFGFKMLFEVVVFSGCIIYKTTNNQKRDTVSYIADYNRVMVFHATFYNISVISWQSVLLVEQYAFVFLFLFILMQMYINRKTQ
jgi:hypothetical protein